MDSRDGFSTARGWTLGPSFLLALSKRGGTDLVGYDSDRNQLYYGKTLTDYGNMVQGVLRSTFLIDEAGVLEKVWKVDKVKGHAAEVLAYMQTRA